MACLAALTISAPVPEADPDAFVNLGAVAIPAITGSALIDGLLLGKVAFLKGKLLPRLKVSTQFRGNFSTVWKIKTLLSTCILRQFKDLCQSNYPSEREVYNSVLI